MKQLSMQSSVGTITLVSDRGALIGAYLPSLPAPDAPTGEDDVLLRARDELLEYFAGERRVFGVPIAPAGTAWQRAVWHELERIPFGETISYGELARRLGRPGAARAAGAANGRNPLSIIVPCHRVIGSGGDLVGYAGGLDVKALLLGHERSCARTASKSRGGGSESETRSPVLG